MVILSLRYMAFVEQRFHCVVGPLRLFLSVIQKDQLPSDSMMVDKSSPRHSPGSDRRFTDYRPDSRGRPNRMSSTGSSQESSPAGSLRSTMSSTLSSTESDQGDGHVTLRDRISHLTRQHLEEGHSVRKIVLQKLQKCRKDMRIIYRWGQASLLDLNDVIDEALADELYFLVRGKMARVLSAISNFDEAAEQIEKNLSHYFQNQSKSAEGDDIGIDIPDFNFQLPSRDDTDTPRYEAIDDLRLNLEGLAEDDDDDEPDHVPRLLTRREREHVEVAAETAEDGESCSTRGSTPEPPVSPRPKGLVKHPKIMKDKLQSYALPSKFVNNSNMRFGRLGSSWSWFVALGCWSVTHCNKGIYAAFSSISLPQRHHSGYILFIRILGIKPTSNGRCSEIIYANTLLEDAL